MYLSSDVSRQRIADFGSIFILQATQQYLESHGVQKAVEDVINATVKAKPEEPFAFMVSWSLLYYFLLDY